MMITALTAYFLSICFARLREQWGYAISIADNLSFSVWAMNRQKNIQKRLAHC